MQGRSLCQHVFGHPGLHLRWPGRLHHPGQYSLWKLHLCFGRVQIHLHRQCGLYFARNLRGEFLRPQRAWRSVHRGQRVQEWHLYRECVLQFRLRRAMQDLQRHDQQSTAGWDLLLCGKRGRGSQGHLQGDRCQHLRRGRNLQRLGWLPALAKRIGLQGGGLQ